MLNNLVSLLLVAILWGGTNPFLKRGSKEILKVKAESCVVKFLLELKYLLTNWEYIIPMTLNQAGSLLYFITLQNIDLSLSVPVANSLTFIFTAISSWMLGEQLPGYSTIVGIIFILAGTTLCCFDKYLTSITA